MDLERTSVELLASLVNGRDDEEVVKELAVGCHGAVA
jgi:hypothetical protein